MSPLIGSIFGYRIIYPEFDPEKAKILSSEMSTPIKGGNTNRHITALKEISQKEFKVPTDHQAHLFMDKLFSLCILRTLGNFWLMSFIFIATFFSASERFVSYVTFDKSVEAEHCKNPGGNCSNLEEFLLLLFGFRIFHLQMKNFPLNLNSFRRQKK